MISKYRNPFSCLHVHKDIRLQAPGTAFTSLSAMTFHLNAITSASTQQYLHISMNSRKAGIKWPGQVIWKGRTVLGPSWGHYASIQTFGELTHSRQPCSYPNGLPDMEHHVGMPFSNVRPSLTQASPPFHWNPMKVKNQLPCQAAVSPVSVPMTSTPQCIGSYFTSNGKFHLKMLFSVTLNDPLHMKEHTRCEYNHHLRDFN